MVFLLEMLLAQIHFLHQAAEHSFLIFMDLAIAVLDIICFTYIEDVVKKWHCHSEYRLHTISFDIDQTPQFVEKGTKRTMVPL